jgi:superfamily II DNA or RNA helicase
MAGNGIGFDRRVLAQIDPAALARGQAVWAKGLVQDLQVGGNGMQVLSAVSGTEKLPYKVSIDVENARGGWRVDGFCRCPVGFNCKHVAATLLAALAGGAAPAHPSGHPSGHPSARPPVGATSGHAALLTGPVTDAGSLSAWLSSLSAAAATVAGSDSDATAFPEHVRWLLNPPTRPRQMPGLVPVLAKLKKAGGLAKVRPLTQQGLAQSSARGVTDADRLLARLIRSASGSGLYTDDGLPADTSLQAEVLQRLLTGGRLHWRTLEAPPLRAGPPRPGLIDWRLDGQGLQICVLRLEGEVDIPADIQAGENILQLLGSGALCPWYVDPQRSFCGPVTLPAPPALVRALLQAPPLDPVAAALVARQLPDILPTLKRSEAAAATAAAAGRLRLPAARLQVEMDDRPPVLHLLLTTHQPSRSGPGRWSAVMEPSDRAILTVDYDGDRVTPGDGPAQFRRMAGERLTVRPRHPGLEAAAIQRLQASGLHPAVPWTEGRTAPLPGMAFAALGPAEDFWLPFLARTVPRLRQEGWQVTVADGFRWTLAEVAGWDASAEATGAGWFDLEVGILVDGQRIPLLPLLLKVLGRGDHAEKLLARDPEAVIYAPLADGRRVALPAARIVPLTRVLLDLFSGSGSLDADGRVRIDLGQAAQLEGQAELPALLQPEQRASLRRLLEPMEEAAEPVGLATELRPYQRRGLAWLRALDAAGVGGVLADDMGLGKTLQVIALLQALKNEGRLQHPALVLAPTSVAPNWLREAGRHAPGLRVHLHQGPDRATRWPEHGTSDLVVSSYPLLLRDQPLLAARPWSLLILDEAQAVKNQAGRLAGLVRTLPAGRRLCVTGTPLENHLGELWTQMDFIMPGLLGDKSSFGRLFRTPVEKKGDTDRQQLLAGRLKPFILRRSKGEVAADLPPKTEILERIPLADDQRDLYETLRLAMDAKVRAAIAARGLGRSHIVILEALLRLRQACCDPLLLPHTGKSPRKAAGSAKRSHLMQMLPEMVEEGRRILLFSQFTGMLDLIRSDLDQCGLRHVSLTGETKDRMAPVDRFQAGEAEIFLISLKAGGTGLTLTAADTVIHYDPWWNPAVEDQATDRAHRIGQDKPVFVYKLVADGTVEDRMLEMQDRKRRLAAAVHDAGPDAPGSLSEDDITRLFAPIL